MSGADGSARVRILCRALHCRATECVGALRLLEVALQVRTFPLVKGQQRQMFVRLEAKATPWVTEGEYGVVRP
jgi:hypothetical protein